LNSFIVKVVGSDLGASKIFSIWQLRTALEEPPVEGNAMECRLWVATEWLIHCAKIIFDDLTLDGEVDTNTDRSRRLGPLCPKVGELSLDRWNFWKSRITALTRDLDSLGVSSSVAGRLSAAMQQMVAAEGQ
jgi:hypothetical protein